jgi:hypothetical protein
MTKPRRPGRSSINPFLRYGLAAASVWAASFLFWVPEILSVNPKGGAPFFVVAFIEVSILSAILLVGCFLLGFLLRIPVLQKVWFSSRAPASVCIVAGHLIYFTCLFLISAAPERAFFPTANQAVLSSVIFAAFAGIAIFAFGFAHFPYLRRSREQPAPPRRYILYGLGAIVFVLLLVIGPGIAAFFLIPTVKPAVAGTYTRSRGAIKETLALKPDGTFHQAITYGGGKSYSADGTWTLSQILLELHGSYSPLPIDDESSPETPERMDELLQYYGNELEQYYGSGNSYQKTNPPAPR